MEYHSPVLLEESVSGLNIKPDGIYVDLTFGGGGHAKEILNRLNNGRLIAFDQDKAALANVFDDDRFLFVNSNFRFFKNFLRYFGIEKVDGILADLGVSSFHFDSSKRGFSFRFDEQMDMRMNPDSKLTAFDLLKDYSEADLFRVFRNYGEVNNASKLAGIIVAGRKQRLIRTTRHFTDLVNECAPKHQEFKYFAKVFQAIRIEVNQEMEVLKEMLEQTPDVLNEDGRLVIITYHSLEDRLVKNFFRKGKFEGELERDIFGNTSIPFEAINRKVIVPQDAEIDGNNRARSAKLRIARKV